MSDGYRPALPRAPAPADVLDDRPAGGMEDLPPWSPTPCRRGAPPALSRRGLPLKIAAAAATLCFLAAGCLRRAPAPAPLLLTGARVLDPAGERLLDGRDVLIENGRIAAIGAAGTRPAPAGTRSIDLAGLTLIPGLIEMHSHLLLHPYDETPWDDQVLQGAAGAADDPRAWWRPSATLEAGFTTVRDLGTEGPASPTSRCGAHRRRHDPRAAHPRRHPRLVATGSYGPSGFDPRWEIPQGAQVVDGPVEMRKAVREQIAAAPTGSRSTPTTAAGPAASRRPPSPRRRWPPRWTRRGAPGSPSPPTPTPRRGSAAPCSPAWRRSSTATTSPTRSSP